MAPQDGGNTNSQKKKTLLFNLLPKGNEIVRLCAPCEGCQKSDAGRESGVKRRKTQAPERPPRPSLQIAAPLDLGLYEVMFDRVLVLSARLAGLI